MGRLPGAELVLEGLADLAGARETVPALLVEIAAPRLERAGVRIPSLPAHPLEAELRLYLRLGERHGAEAHAQYNALLRRLTSFCRALEGRAARG